EQQHGKGTALPSLAPRLARAVSHLRTRPTACAMEQCLPGAGRRAGEPGAALAPHGIRLHPACSTSGVTASVTAKGRIGVFSQSLGRLIGHPLWLLYTRRESQR